MDDWQPGDLALCIKKSGPCRKCRVDGLYRVGAVYTVSDTVGMPVWALFFVGLPRESRANGCWHIAYDASFFRKLRPHEADAEDIETIQLYRRHRLREPV